ncbi:MAG TPA: (2Fe-2S)-binding protein, partial [Bacillota bacterium]|nr:(2Fe-2S)-binding protein [Bacillota bacterium]
MAERETQDDNIVICRCEDITLSEIRDLIAQGYHTIDEIKRVSRAGMGPCQGRTCRQLIA